VSAVAIIEVHRGEDGVWEVHERHVLESGDLETVDDLSGFDAEAAQVRVSGVLKALTVYREDDEDGFVVMDELYA
jgi:hypothetical protein